MGYYDGKKVLVTGGTGYLGSALVASLTFNNPDCSVKILTEDIRSEYVWEENLKDIDIVFHLAAQTSVYKSNDNPRANLEVNVTPIVNLLTYLNLSKKRPDIIFSSSATVIGMGDGVPVTIYDINKLSVENYLRYYSGQMGGRSVSLRISNLYGPGKDQNAVDRGVVKKMMACALLGKPITVYGDGSWIRDYIFISDVVEALLKSGENMDKLKGNSYSIGTGVGNSLKQMAEAIANRLNGKVDFVPIPEGLSPIEFRSFIADSSDFKSLTGWQPKVSLAEGIDKTLAWSM